MEIRSTRQINRLSRYLFALLIFAVFSIVVIPVLFGRPFRLERIPDMGKTYGCATCHLNHRGGGQLNPFGNDYKEMGIRKGDRYIKSLGEMDSDKDGFTNDHEFSSGAHPGDPESKPVK